MKRRPQLLILVALIFLGIVVSFPVQIFLLYDHSLSEFYIVLGKISFLNYLVAFALLANIPLILKASQWLWVSLPLTILLVTWNNWVVASAGQDLSKLTVWLSTGSFVALSCFIFLPPIWKLLQEPKCRWWLQAPRKKTSLPVTIEPVRGTSIQTSSFDLSQTGAFIPDNGWTNQQNHPIDSGDVITVRLKLGPLSQISCLARVVRKAFSSGRYPDGFGLQFLEFKPGHKRLLRNYVNSSLKT